MTRYLLFVLPALRSQLREWERIATSIPDARLRELALATLRSERLSAAGAALLAATTDRYEPELVRALIAFQIAWDYLDTLAEQPTADPIAHGAWLHRALADALDARRPRVDYYAFDAASDDGGYLAALVETCCRGCTSLPAYERVRDRAVAEALRAEVQGINHAPAEVRAPHLRRWAASHGVGEDGWIELAAAASSSLGLLALMAAAADPCAHDDTLAQVYVTYFPWVDALTTLLDSFVDRREDAASGALSFIGQYPSERVADARLQTIARQAIGEARKLDAGERHVVVISGMVAMHLSRPEAWLPASLALTLRLLRACGTIVTPLLLALLLPWRLIHVFSTE